jgi:DNA repair exonuclease SbcCD ATPase subunit
MKITFQKIIFRNFLSYGNRDTELDFSTPGLISLSGKNGQGKSVLLDAINFALFGKPYRKIKINELINRTNKKNLWVQLYFQQNMTDYRITRTLGPASTKVEYKKINEAEYTELELLSSNRLIQDEINKIFGIDFDTFKHIVAIASSASQSRPFLALSAGDKRGLIESVFNLEIIGELFKLIKSDKSTNKSKILTSSQAVNLYTNLVAQLENQYNSALQTIASFTDNKTSMIKNLLTKKETTLTEITSQVDLAEKLSKFINKEMYKTIEAEIVQLNTQKESVTNSIGECSAQIKHANKMLASLGGIDICPSCNTKITEEHRANEIAHFNYVVDVKIEEKETLEKELHNIKYEIKLKTKNLEDMNLAKNKVSNLLTKIDSLKENITEYENQIIEKEKEELNIDVTNIETLIKENTLNKETAISEQNECSEKEVILEIADFLLSDNGIKTEFYNIVVPIFNKTVNDYLKKFELPVVITFDYEFNYTIKSVQSQDSDINYYAFSEGEKKRIDISVMLTFIKLSKSIANWSTNIMIADEVFDGGIDNEGLTTILETVRGIAAEEQLSLFIVSHKILDNSEIFDRNLLVIKDNGYSKMMYID